MKKFFTFLALLIFLSLKSLLSQTVVPNGDLENWINHTGYSNPQFWDTPNAILNAIPFIGVVVVSKSTDHQSGSFSAKLETKSYVLSTTNIPGVITLGIISIDFTNGSYGVTGGVPIHDLPTHLMGFYKFIPKGGDTCAIGIGLSRWKNNIRDSVGYGVFSTHDTVNTWTPFSAWIDYIDTVHPDTMNILAISSAMEAPTVGTILYVDDLYLDYTVGINNEDPANGIETYNDWELKELSLFLDFASPRQTQVRLFNSLGQVICDRPLGMMAKGRITFNYSVFPPGMYILQVVHSNRVFNRKFILN